MYPKIALKSCATFDSYIFEMIPPRYTKVHSTCIPDSM